MAENTGQKQRGGFKPGESGNPTGRPRGARNKATVMAEKLMVDDAEAVVRAVIKKAKDGDMTAARLIIERIAPAPRGRAVDLDLPLVKTAADISAAMAVVISAMAEGLISPEEAQIIAAIFETRRRTIETEEFGQRIAALETQPK